MIEKIQTQKYIKYLQNKCHSHRLQLSLLLAGCSYHAKTMFRGRLAFSQLALRATVVTLCLFLASKSSKQTI